VAHAAAIRATADRAKSVFMESLLAGYDSILRARQANG